ncbi:MAG: AraC family transcriptional regulator [Clostridiaceae bacterium]|nr:AraC family transcriptional regulator [Clostridiaceae bacterium]
MEQRTYLHHFLSPSKMAKDALFYIESVGHYQCDKSFYEDSYYQQNYYLIYVISGKGYICSQNEKITVLPGQLAFIHLSEPYKYYPHKKDPWEILWIYFGGKDADWFYQLITGKSKVIFTLSATSRIPCLLKDIYNLNSDKDSFFEIRTSNLINTLLTDLYIESKKENSNTKTLPFEYPNPVNTVINFIEQNYFRKITLDELSSITYLSTYYLLRLFKKYTGYTPGEYINKYRLDFSKKLLLEPELTIKQIALNLGFNTHSYFSKLFRQSTGLSPEQFRNSHMR